MLLFIKVMYLTSFPNKIKINSYYEKLIVYDIKLITLEFYKPSETL